jgi:hypothetical protein
VDDLVDGSVTAPVSRENIDDVVDGCGRGGVEGDGAAFEVTLRHRWRPELRGLFLESVDEDLVSRFSNPIDGLSGETVFIGNAGDGAVLSLACVGGDRYVGQRGRK